MVPWIPSSDFEAFRRTKSLRLSCVSPGTLFVLKYRSLTRCEGRFPGTFRTFCITHPGLCYCPSSCGDRAWLAGVAGTILAPLL